MRVVFSNIIPKKSLKALGRALMLSWLLSITALFMSGCSVIENSITETGLSAATPIPPARLYEGASVSGAWTPAVTGGGAANLKGTVTVATSTITLAGSGMVRLNEAWGAKEVLVDLGTYDGAADFGPNGSITLSAEVLGYPYNGGAYPVLTSFYSDNSTYEHVNLTSDCATSGVYVCSGFSCTTNSACKPQAASGFSSLQDWNQHQVFSYGYTSVNSFPRCDDRVTGWGSCPAAISPTATASLRSGHYYAKYILLSDRSSSVASDSVTLQVKVTVKKDTVERDNVGLAKNGAIDLNVILVGSKNINDSHTTVGAQNLNLLFTEVHQLLKDNSKVGINQINVYEWRDVDGGDFYSQVDYSNIGVMFSSGSQAVNASTEGNAINVFLVSDISYSGSFTILGLAGAIHGPPVNGTQASGLAFSSFDQLLTFNASCTVGNCPRNSQDNDFLEMGATIAHELGHYLGLNHPSERTSSPASQRHDGLADTPQCSPRWVLGSYVLDQRACYNDAVNTLNGDTCADACNTYIDANVSTGGQYFTGGGSTPNFFCSSVSACQFNHVMWYTTKNRKKVSGAWTEDGSLISTQASSMVQWNSFVK